MKSNVVHHSGVQHMGRKKKIPPQKYFKKITAHSGRKPTLSF